MKKKSRWFRLKSWWEDLIRCGGVCYSGTEIRDLDHRCTRNLFHFGLCRTEYGDSFDWLEEYQVEEMRKEKARRYHKLWNKDGRNAHGFPVNEE